MALSEVGIKKKISNRLPRLYPLLNLFLPIIRLLSEEWQSGRMHRS